MNINELHTRIRKDLKDEDPNNYRWTNDELDRHIFHAVYKFSIAIPAESKTTLYTTSGSREISLTSLNGLIAVLTVEYPTGNNQPPYVRFRTWENTLTLLIDNIPQGNEPVDIHYLKQHTLDSQGSSIPPKYEDIIATGATAYATLALANYSVDRTNTGGEQVSNNYLEWAKIKLEEFKTWLAKHDRKNTIRVNQFYSV
jgi:hypothetical protein